MLPLSLHENVALGLPERRATDAEVQEALRQGGATRFMGKMKEGTETVLDPITGACAWLPNGEDDKDLRKVNEEVGKKTELSGGEKQRLAA